NKCDAHSEIKKITNDSGQASFSFMNTVDESFGKCVERIYTITAEFGGYTNSTIGQVNGTNKNYQLWLPFIMQTISVRDASNNSIMNATVTALNTSFYTDISGNAYILLPVGMNTQVLVTYGNVSKQITANPSLQSYTIVNLQVYNLKVSLTDENGNILKGKIRYNDEEKVLEGDFVTFEKFSDLNPTFYVIVNNVTKRISEKVTSDNLVLRFDLTPPIISNVETRVSNNRLYITATVVDGGRYPSGISSYPLLSYVGNATQDSNMKMFFVGNSRYETSIPLSGNEEIKYTITATDAQGNSAQYSDSYYSSFKPEKEIEKVTKGGFSWITFLGIFVFAVIIYVIYLKIKEQTK
ncbi:MAG: hypothetical protein ACPLYF_05600, partial [Fervidobacterium sp.]